MSTSVLRKKLIEVSIPLEAINAASAREKSIKHGHPSTVHLWWARRPLAACRAVLFAQFVDDPSAWPDRFPTKEAQDTERRRLHKVIEAMVPWEASTNESILNAARWEIARSIAWGLGEDPPAKDDSKAVLSYLQKKAPPVFDPFSGGGSIPLEAQRLGLRAYGSDINPVAVLIGKSLIEIPPKFAGLPPINSKSRAEIARGGTWNAKGAQGLAEDVRYYGQWMRDEAEKRIGHLYPKVKLPDGSEATVIAWLWARTVRSPDPAAKGAMVPLVSSFMLSTKEGKKAWVEPIIDPMAVDGWRFEVKSGSLSKEREKTLNEGTMSRSGGTCLLTGTFMPFEYIREQGKSTGLSERLMAIVAEGNRRRIYLSPNEEHSKIAEIEKPDIPDLAIDISTNTRDFRTQLYGLPTFRDLFSSRQLLALTTLTNLVSDVREKALMDARSAHLPSAERLSNGGTGAEAYADAIATYLGMSVSRTVNRGATLTFWDNSGQKIQQVFARQALPMVWDYVETNFFSTSTGNFYDQVEFPAKSIAGWSKGTQQGEVYHIDASKNSFPIQPIVLSTDPPYYDNIGYADLSDFFYVWLRLSLSNIWPDLFRRLITPKSEELVADPHRHGSKDAAEAFFMKGMSSALTAMRKAATDKEPLTIYYAFKQSEVSDNGITSAGWSSFLQAVVDSGLVVDGTWPVRTELVGNLKNKVNALASSIVLVCRKRDAKASIITRADFIRLLRRELPDAIDAIRKAGVGPVDMQQSVIGPGMGVFSRHTKVLEDDDRVMTVKTALSLINRVWEEIDQEVATAFDAETQVALAWFATYGFETKPSGELIVLANAKTIAINDLYNSGVFQDLRGRSALTPRNDLPRSWSPSTDKTLTVWECVQHTARILNSDDGGAIAAAQLVSEMGVKAADARALAYRLFEIATQKGWATEALIYNELAQEWPKLEELASNRDLQATSTKSQAELF